MRDMTTEKRLPGDHSADERRQKLLRAVADLPDRVVAAGRSVRIEIAPDSGDVRVEIDPPLPVLANAHFSLERVGPPS